MNARLGEADFKGDVADFKDIGSVAENAAGMDTGPGAATAAPTATAAPPTKTGDGIA